MLLYILDLLGVAVFAVSGILAAGNKGLDWVGMVLVAAVTAVGGGTLRDLLLNREAVFWIKDPTYIWVMLLAATVTLLYAHYFELPYRVLLVADALGLALFSITGAQVAEASGVAPIIIVMMGTMTGVVGGVVRDMLINEIPIICRPTEPIYTFPAVVGILAYLGLLELGLARDLSMGLGICTVATLRLAAIFWHIRLPKFCLAGTQSESSGSCKM